MAYLDQKEESKNCGAVLPGHSKPEMIKKVQTDSEKDWKASVGWKFQMFSLQSQNR